MGMGATKAKTFVQRLLCLAGTVVISGLWSKLQEITCCHVLNL